MRQIKIKIIVLAMLYLVVVQVFSYTQEKKLEVKKSEVSEKKEEKEVMVQVMHNDVQTQIPLEKYLEGVVASEMPYTFEMEALKAQCVAARTFVLQRNLIVDDTTSSQVYRSENELIEIHQDNYETMITKIREAITQTKGLVMRYDGAYISALFYSCNNGQSNDASWYYKNEAPYLKSVDSKWDLNYEACAQVKTYTKQEVQKALGVSNVQVNGVEHYANGYVKRITIGGSVFSGREVREKLGLRSSCFRFEEQTDSLLIYTKGFGHGVGMSQYGADGMAKEGYNFKEILEHYYQGVTIEQI